MIPGFERYTDRYGMLHTEPVNGARDPSTRNGLTYTGYVYIMRAMETGEYGVLRASWRVIVSHCEIIPGLYSRGPNVGDQQAQDDLMMIACAAIVLGAREECENILEYMRKHRLFGVLPYFYNTSNPGSQYHQNSKRINWSAYMGRYPALIAMLQWGARERPSDLSQLIVAGSIRISAKNPVSNQDAWLQSHCIHLALNHAPVIQAVKDAQKEWVKRKPTPMREVLADYLEGPTMPIEIARAHPMVQIWGDYS